MKKLVSAFLATAMAATLATGVSAAGWFDSSYQTGPELAGNQLTVTDASGVKSTVDVSDGGILVTNVANTLDYSGKLDVPTSDKTNVVYYAALATNSTSDLLGKFGNAEEATSAIETQIAANKAVTVERLNAQRDELSAKVEQLKADGASEDDIAAAEQQLAQAEAEIAATEAADYDSMDNYEAAALFDVSVSGDMEQMLAAGGSVEIPVKVDGITPESDVLALHFVGDLTDASTVAEKLQTDVSTTVDGMNVEVIPCTPGDGMVTLTMSSFSPVMILTRAQTEVTVEEPAEQATTADSSVAATPAPQEAPQESVEETSTGSNVWIYIVVVIVVVVIAGAVVVTRKKKTVTAGKK